MRVSEVPEPLRSQWRRWLHTPVADYPLGVYSHDRELTVEEEAMPTIQLQIDKETLEKAQQLARNRHVAVEDLISELIGQLTTAAATDDPFLGMLADEPELADQVTELAMAARERDPWRVTGCG